MKRVQIKIYARVCDGYQVIAFHVVRRNGMRRYVISGTLEHAPDLWASAQINRAILSRAWSLLRYCWRNEVLGADWGERKARKHLRIFGRLEAANGS